MRIIVVGGTGTIGKAVVKELAPRHEVIIVGQNSGDLHVDITNNDSIKKMFHAIGKFDALVATTGSAYFGSLTEMTDENLQVGLKSKLMGQINLVLIGLPYMHIAGSFTLTSGILNHDPIRLGINAAMVNGAIDGFVKSAALEMPREGRINAVSPTVVTESMDKYEKFFPGFKPVPALEVARGYCKSVEGAQTGQIYRVGY